MKQVKKQPKEQIEARKLALLMLEDTARRAMALADRIDPERRGQAAAGVKIPGSNLLRPETLFKPAPKKDVST